jgi:hypothetical protein
MRAALLRPIALCACAHAQVGVNSGPPTTAGAAGVQVSAGAAFAAVLLTGIIATAAMQDAREPRASMYGDWWWSPPAPPMSSDRVVTEQDCTKPIASGGNLRCR